MKGKAHDELHKWLHPFMSRVNGYSIDMAADQKRDWFNEVEGSMNDFEQYFEWKFIREHDPGTIKRPGQIKEVEKDWKTKSEKEGRPTKVEDGKMI